MKTSKTVRTYKYLILTIINFIALFIAKKYYEYLENLSNPYLFSGDEREKIFYSEIIAKQEIFSQIFVISILLFFIYRK